MKKKKVHATGYREREFVELKSGKVLWTYYADDGEGSGCGHWFELMPNGRTVREWRQTWVNEYEPTDTVYPNIIAALRWTICS